MDEPDLPRLARTIGEPTRMGMLALLMEGRALTAKELAYGCGVQPGTATEHLKRLQRDGLITSTAQGRHKHSRVVSISELGHQALAREFGLVIDSPENDQTVAISS